MAALISSLVNLLIPFSNPHMVLDCVKCSSESPHEI